MWRIVIAASILILVTFCVLKWEQKCCLTQQTKMITPELEEEPMIIIHDNRAGQEMFPPDKFLVRAWAIWEECRDEYSQRSLLRIERVYVGDPCVKGRIFEAVQGEIDLGVIHSWIKFPNLQNPPIKVGEVGIWWVMKSGFKDNLVADFDSGLAQVGGCEPVRKGIVSNSDGHRYPPYEDALEYASLWSRLYNASNTQSQMIMLRQAVSSRNPLISDGAFNLLFYRRPPGFLECLKELTADPNVPADKLRVIKDFVDGVGKKKVKEPEPQPF